MTKRLLFVLLALVLATSAWATEVPGYGDIILERTWITSSGSVVNHGEEEDLNWQQCDYYVWYNSAKSIAIIRYVNYQHLSSSTTFTVPTSLSIGGKSHKVVGLWKLDNRQMILDNGKITTLNLPEGLEFIKGEDALALANITSLTLPASLTWMSEKAPRCPRVTTLTLKDSATPLTIDGFHSYTYGVFGYMPVTTATVGRSMVCETSPFGCSDDDMSLTTLTITGAMKTMRDNMFRGQRKLATVTIKEGVTNIGKSAFLDCGKLTAITIPNSVKKIGENAFDGDTLLAKVNLGSGVKYIEDFAFLNCREVTSLTIPASLDSVWNHAFENMTGVRTLTIEDNSKPLLIKGFTSYSGGAFMWFANGFTATMGRNFNLVSGDGAADANPPFGYSGVGKLTMNNTVTKLNNDEFYACGLLKTVSLSQNITDIPQNAFRNDTLLTGIAIPDKVTHIGNSAFSCDSMMTTLTMSKGIKYIEEYAFANCKRVPSLVLPASLDSVWNHAFENMTGVRTLTIEDNSKPLLIKGFTSYSGGAFRWFANGFTATMGRNFNLVSGDNVADANPPFGYSGVGTLTIGSMVGKLNNDEFYNCEKLTKIISKATNVPQCPSKNVFYKVNKSIPVYVPKGTISKYKADPVWMDFFNYYEDDSGKPGDITGDGFIDVDDMNIIINIMVKKNGNPAYESAADLNHDGVVDIDDLNIVINIMVGKG